MDQAEKKNFKDSLNLPTTSFEIRSNPKQKEPELLNRWKETDLYKKTYKKNFGKKKFILSDGPPYANGHIHIGTALNKILKDIVCKYKRMSGFHVPLKPVWDCHGLPIELKVSAELGLEKTNQINAEVLKGACRAFAQKWIKTQAEEFIRLGVVADFDLPYYTMHPKYQADILRAFSIFVQKGFIERKGKTVPWCASCKTVLATAEIEYQDRKDPSIYLLFGLEKSAYDIFEDVLKNNPDLKINFLVWTTTPWTLPLNRAIALNPDADYVLLAGKNPDEAFIVVEAGADAICRMLEIDKNILAKVPSTVFKNKRVSHPFDDGRFVPIILDEMVVATDGTGVLHVAPGCGPEDYLTGVKNDLEIYSPISEDGKYSFGIKPEELEGMPVSDGQIWAIKKLLEKNLIYHKTSIKHSYPHCWRCRNGLIFRATDQWFCNLEKNELIKSTLLEIAKLQFVPETGRARLSSTIGNRTEWCISRQRQWGVPIVALLCDECGSDFITPDFIKAVAEGVEKVGIEYWDRVTVKDLAANNLLPKDFSCKKCDNKDLEKFRQERDILDVWFDSGVSHYAVLDQFSELGSPADIYLEGSDQHRGWFQSSLLSSMVMKDCSPTKSFVTHGFVVDGKGHKMSKSLGNVISPLDVIQNYSADILRLWVASSDYEGDIAISELLLKNVAEVYRKIRNTLRFLLSNLYDFDLTKDEVSYKDMLEIDKYALLKLTQLNEKIHEAYSKYDFTSVFHLLGNYCASDLSAFYLDVSKDRLYVEKPKGKLRLSAQTACWYILDTLTKLCAPILSFLSEEVSDCYQTTKSDSIHLQDFAMLKAKFANLESVNIWNYFFEFRTVALSALEKKREAELIKHSLEANVKVYFDRNSKEGQEFTNFLNSLDNVQKNRFLRDLIIVSQLEILDSKENLESTEVSWINLSVEHAAGFKCLRCWQWDVNENADQLCSRCVEVLS